MTPERWSREAKVTLTGPNGFVKIATSDNSGAYTFTGLATGDYQVVASAPDLTMLQPLPISLNPGIQTLNLSTSKLVGTRRACDRTGECGTGRQHRHVQ